MSNRPIIYLTRSKYSAYEQQLKYMEGDGAQKLSTFLASSPSSGMGRPLDLPIHDLARRFYSEIDELRFKINHALIIDDILKSYDDTTQANIGATVTFTEKKSGETDTFLILGPDEANPTAGIISYQSPLGSAIIGKQKGEYFRVETTGIEYRIEKVDYLSLAIKSNSTDWETILDNAMV